MPRFKASVNYWRTEERTVSAIVEADNMAQAEERIANAVYFGDTVTGVTDYHDEHNEYGEVEDTGDPDVTELDDD